VKLSWTAATDNVGVTGYEVSRDGVLLATVSTPSFTDSNLSPTTNYTYSIVAVDAASNGSTPAQISITTLAAPDTQAPTKPGTLVFSSVNSASVTVTWAASTDNVGVTGYRVSRGGVLLDTVTNTSFTDPGLTPATSYSYSVVAVDAASNASTASTGNVTTLSASDTQPPSAPGALVFSNVSASSVTVTWTAAQDNVGVTGYKVSRNGSVITTTTALSVIDSPLAASTTYNYSVVALDAAGNASTASTGTIATSSGGSTGNAIRVNAGGPSYVDSLGNTWSADTGFYGGATAGSSATVTNTADPTLFKSERYTSSVSTPFTYTFNVANGTYLVRLHFAETYSGTKGIGKRIFDIDINAVRAFEDVDIFKLAGTGDKATKLEKSVTVTDGKIKIAFIHQVQNPKVNAIEIIPSP
jgi:chitodextrinase